jgi:hypothetical protein
MLATESIPVLYLEMEIGQRMRNGVIGACNQVSPYVGGTGIPIGVVSFRRGAYGVLLAKTEGKIPFDTPRRILEDNIKMNFWKGM